MAIYNDINNKTKDGRSWFFKTSYIDLSGKRRQYKSKKFGTKRECSEQERLFLLNTTDQIDTKKMTFQDIFDSYIEFKSSKVKITSLISIKNRIKYLESLNNIIVSQFKLSQFNQWKKYMNNQKFSTSFKNNCYNQLKAVLKYANIYFDINNQELVKLTNFTDPNELKEEMLFFSHNEFKQFINVEDNINYKSFFSILYFCGLRLGEAQALMWKDIDFNNNNIFINKNLSTKIKGVKYVILSPKTKSSIRTIPIPNNVLGLLKTLYKDKSTIINFDNNYFVFGDINPIANTTVQKRKNENCKNANVKQIRIHDFRHSCASLLINNGANVTLVASYLGHSNITTTLNTYTHLFDNQLTDITKLIGKL